ncbi:dimerization domain protein, hAT family [Necator americanus]|uniref:Dimerization domain protein, hAT family n=1 Tax=Necator americanus TaxID=51031 RepID=W2TN14_NECAM|nr:dimerization domain protein, hAT family [Necator americanus]ETN82521.1 dimerization domain protein, hAT family [Necator americanus]
MGKYSEYFIVFENMLICKTCNWAIPKPKDCTTSSLRHHLKKKHPELYSSFKDKDERTKTERTLAAERAVALAHGLQRTCKSEPETGPGSSSTQPQQPYVNSCPPIPQTQLNVGWDPDRDHMLLVDRAITQMMCTAVLPPSFLDNPGFRNLIAVTAPRFQLKSREFFTTSALGNLYEEYYSKIKTMLDTAAFVSFSSDVRYLSEEKGSLVVITAYFIDGDMMPRFVVVAVSLVPGIPCADDVRALFSKMLNLYDVKEEKLHVLVEHSPTSDAAIVNGIKRVNGFAYKLQEAVEDGLSMLLGENDELLFRLKEIYQIWWKHDPTKHMRDCTRLCHQSSHGNQIKKIDMCWNCLYQMLSRLDEEKNTLSFVLVENPHFADIKGTEWELVREIIDVLKPLDFALGLVKHRFFTPTSVVIPLYKVILRQLKEDKTCMKAVKEAICKKLSALMEGCELQEELFLATYVDPRFRGAYFTADKRQGFLEKIEEMAFLPVLKPVEVVEQQRFEDFSNPFIAFRKHEPQESANNSKLEAGTKALAELEDYLSQDPAFTADPYEYWRNDVNSAKYPLIKKLALKYLSAPGISIDCQSIFSQLECITSELRNNWESEDLEKLLFLHHNILIYGF